MRTVLLGRDLIIASRIAAEAERAGTALVRADSPADLPPPTDVDLLLVDWGDRLADWPEALAGWCASAPKPARPRVVAFGPHTDLIAHQSARAAGFGPMLARSALIRRLPGLIAGDG